MKIEEEIEQAKKMKEKEAQAQIAAAKKAEKAAKLLADKGKKDA